jgi:riboflavin kinase
LAKKAKIGSVSANMNPSKILSLKGKVFSGTGEGAKFTELPWAKQQIVEKIGFTPYPGTLNIKLTKNSLVAKNSLKKTNGIEILSTKDFCRGKCFHAYMDDLKCAVVIPEVEDYPEDVIEIIAPVNLREKFKLKDGNVVEVKALLE